MLVVGPGFTIYHKCHERIDEFRHNQPNWSSIALVNKQLYRETINFYGAGIIDWHFCSVICANHYSSSRVVKDDSALIGWTLRVHCCTGVVPEIKIREGTMILDYINEMDRHPGFAQQRYGSHLDHMLGFQRDQLSKGLSRDGA